MTALLAPAVAHAPVRVLAGILAGAGAAIAGLAVVSALVLVGWAGPGVEPTGSDAPSAVAALRVAGLGWLVAHHVPLLLPTGVAAWLPLGLLVIPVGAAFSAAQWVVRRISVTRLRDAAVVIVAMAVTYGAVAACVAALVSTETVRARPVVSAVAAGLLVAVAASAGLRQAGIRVVKPWPALPVPVRASIAGGMAGVAVLVAGGALLTVAALTLRRDSVAQLVTTLDAGLIGSVLLVLLSAAYVPNVVVWGAAYALGPGFSIGAGTSVSALGVEIGALPALPLLGALPSPGQAPAPSLLALLVPVTAGVIVGRVLARRLRVTGWTTSLWVLAAAVFAGLVMGVLAAMSGGPLGGQRLVVIGPSTWQVAVCTAIELAVVAAPTAWLASRGWQRP